MLLFNVYGVQTLVNSCVKLGGLRPVRPNYLSGCFKAIQRCFFRNLDLGPHLGRGKSSHYWEETEKGETTDWKGHPQFQYQKVEPTHSEGAEEPQSSKRYQFRAPLTELLSDLEGWMLVVRA